MVHWCTRSEMLYWQFAYVVFRKYTKLFKIKQVDQVLMTVSLKEWDTFLHLDFHDCSDKGPGINNIGKKDIRGVFSQTKAMSMNNWNEICMI
jgi:hypothetical protein